ncbi:MAG: hypothetical protein AAF598_14430 [Bacteroidota bacterium]
MKGLLPLCLSSLLALQLQGQGWEYYEDSFFTSNRFKDIEITNDGGCLISGCRFDNAPTSNPNEGALAKLDQDGNFQWLQEFSNPSSNSFWIEAMDQSSTNEFCLGGNSGDDA